MEDENCEGGEHQKEADTANNTTDNGPNIGFAA